MSTSRLVTAEARDEDADVSLRPQRLADFIGQDKARANLQVFIEAARGVLWLLVILGELLTSGVLRRMEYDADRVMGHVAGCREFVTVHRLTTFLDLAARRARADVADAWEQRRLADDMPRLVVAHARQLARHKDDILKAIDAQTTGVFDSHPCYNDRVAAVNDTAAPVRNGRAGEPPPRAGGDFGVIR